MVRSWNEESVIYHPDSGDTHLIDEAALAILKYLQGRDADTQMLIAEVMHNFPDQNAQELPVFIERTLLDLAQLGLIEKTAQ